MSHSYSNSCDPSWAEKSTRKESLRDASMASNSRNSLSSSSSSSQSDCAIPPPPPDSDENSDSVDFLDGYSDCSSICGGSPTTVKSKYTSASSDSKSKRYDADDLRRNELFETVHSIASFSTRQGSAVLDSSTKKSSLQSYHLYNRTEPRQALVECSYGDNEEDECGDSKLGDSECENSTEFTSPDWRPRKSFINISASEESESSQWIIRRRLLSLMRVARMFALRCGFDHWKCAGAKNSECKSAKRLSLEKLSVSSELSRKLFGMLERAVIRVTIRSAFCILVSYVAV